MPLYPRELPEPGEYTSTPPIGGTGNVLWPPRPRGVLFGPSRRTCSKTTEALREASHNCQAVVDNARREHWERFCTEKITGPEDTCITWKKVSELRRRACQPERPLLVDNRYTEVVQENTEVLAGVFSRANQSRHLPRRWPGTE